jgi:hypothetical protein
MEMTVRGKSGKPKAGFSAFPLPLETPQKPRAFHIPTAPTAAPYIYGRNLKTLAVNINPEGGPN